MTAAYEALIEAVKMGDIERCQALVTQCDPTSQDNLALTEAGSSGNLELVKLLLECGGDPTARENNALTSAARNGHLDVVKFLLECGGDPTAKGNQAIINASENGHLEVVKLLLECGANATAQANKAIICANEEGHTEVVKLLSAWSPLSLLPLPVSTWRDVLGTTTQALQALNPDDSDEKKAIVIAYHVNISQKPFSRLLAEAPDDLKPFYLAHLSDI